MKKGYVLQSLICLLAVSCSVQEMETLSPIPAEDDVFYASFESYSEPDTKVYVDKDNTVDGKIKLFWNAKDQISIFNKSTLNQQYEFMGETGDNSGFFKIVSEGSGTRAVADYVYAVYPYQESTSLDNSGVLTLTLPAEQTYKEKSFGPGANTMVSTTDGENNFLKFKNVGGYLVFNFYGDGVSLSAIKIEGRNGELLSGEAIITPSTNTDPIIEMAPTAGTSITLTCDKAVKLEKNKNKATEFWMVVPPTEFTNGLKMTLTDKNGIVYYLNTNMSLSIKRNEVLRITATEVKLEPKKVIYYATSDLSVITPDENANFGANIICNVYAETKGVLVFDGNVSQIGDNAFKDCKKLISITIPETVTSIGDKALYGCTALSSITIQAKTPPSVTNDSFGEMNACSFFVPADSFINYLEADGWNNYDSMIQVIPNLGPVSGKILNHDYIDMGKGLKWASMNIGATKPDGSGDFFAWGETEPISLNLSASEYNFNAPFLDAATVIWGESWRMPTLEEFNALMDNADFTWAWDPDKKGYLVVSKVPGYVGNTIFLPAAGVIGEGQVLMNKGYEGDYWSATIDPEEEHCAMSLFFDHSGVFTGNYGRGGGMTIRPVSN